MWGVGHFVPRSVANLTWMNLAVNKANVDYYFTASEAG